MRRSEAEKRGSLVEFSPNSARNPTFLFSLVGQYFEKRLIFFRFSRALSSILRQIAPVSHLYRWYLFLFSPCVTAAQRSTRRSLRLAKIVQERPRRHTHPGRPCFVCTRVYDCVCVSRFVLRTCYAVYARARARINRVYESRAVNRLLLCFRDLFLLLLSFSVVLFFFSFFFISFFISRLRKWQLSVTANGYILIIKVYTRSLVF